jgi:PleD family two-component response regulator
MRRDMPMHDPDRSEPDPGQGRRCVLVVDDALTIRLYCRQHLEAAGFSVVEAVNGLEGLVAAVRLMTGVGER